MCVVILRAILEKTVIRVLRIAALVVCYLSLVIHCYLFNMLTSESTCSLTCVHGTCYSNECLCSSAEWTGLLCDTSSIQPVTGISYNKSNPSVTVNTSSLFQYDILITTLVELDSNGIHDYL
jgi:hypothetical protein